MGSIYNPVASSGGSSVIEATRVEFKAVGGAEVTTAGGTQIIKYDTITFDPKGRFNTSTYTYTVPSTGTYHISGNVSATTSGQMQMLLYKNGAALVVGPSNVNAYADSYVDVLNLTAGDTITLYVYTAASVTLDSNLGRSYASFVRLL